MEASELCGSGKYEGRPPVFYLLVQLERLGERAAKLKDPGYLQRVKEHAARTVRLGVDMVTMEKDTQKLVAQKEIDAVAVREVNPRTATFDDEAAQELAWAPNPEEPDARAPSSDGMLEP